MEGGSAGAVQAAGGLTQGGSGGLAGSESALVGGSGGQAGSIGIPGAGAGAGPVGTPYVYVGSGFYDISNPQLYVFKLDPETGALTEIQKMAVDAYPSFIAVSPNGRHLYVNVENATGSAIAYAIDPLSGMLTRLNDIENGGSGSAYITTDSAGKHVLQVNYESGSVVVLSTLADGSLGQVVDEKDLGGQDAYPHSVLVDPTDQFVFVTNRWNPGAPGNYIAQFRFNAQTGALTPNNPARVDLPFGMGPRHFAFHPSQGFAFVNNERNSTVSAYAYDAGAGTLAKLQEVSTVPEGFDGSNAPADMRIHPSGKFLYVANRGQHSLAIIGVEGGALTALGHETFPGEPRNLFVDPTGRFVVVGDLEGDKVRVYRIDAQTGMLTAAAAPPAVQSPSGIALAYVAAN